MSKLIRLAVFLAVLFLFVPAASAAKHRGKPVPLETQWVTAVHEAAHAVVGIATNPTYSLTFIWEATRQGDDLGGTGYFYGEAYSRTPNGARSRAAACFAGAKAEKLLLGLEATGISNDLQVANLTCQTQKEVTECLDSALKLAETAIISHSRTIKLLAELLMNQPPDRKDRRRYLKGPKVELTTLKWLLQDLE